MKMQTRVLAAAVMIAAAGAARADLFEKGVKAGVDIATLTGSGVKNADNVLGLNAGIFVSFALGPVALEPDLLFAAKGSKASDTFLGTATTITNNFNYIDIPILVKYVLMPAGPVKPYIGAGPQLSFLMSAKSKTELAGATTTTDVKSSLSSADYSVVVEAGLGLGLGITTLSADVRYAVGLADISKTSGVNTKNSVISILVGATF